MSMEENKPYSGIVFMGRDENVFISKNGGRTWEPYIGSPNIEYIEEKRGLGITIITTVKKESDNSIIK
jgi:hypothetical protein